MEKVTTGRRVIIFGFLLIAMLVFAMIPITANAKTASELKTQIGSFNPGTAARLTASVTNTNEVTVTGVISGVINQL